VCDYEAWCRFPKILEDLVSSYADAEELGYIAV